MKKMMIALLLMLPAFVFADVFQPLHAQQIPQGTPPNITLPAVENPLMFQGKVVAILASHGVEESEIVFPYRYLTQRGAQVDILVPAWTPEGVVTSRFLMPSLFAKATGTFPQGLTRHYDLIVLTGGAWNAQVVRSDSDAMKLIRQHYQGGRPIAAICAGTSVLINADLVKGRTMTGSPVVKLDLQMPGPNTWTCLLSKMQELRLAGHLMIYPILLSGCESS